MIRHPNFTQQRGVALIMVLAMVAIIATWAATAAYEDMISIRRVSNLQDELRATMASESAISLFRLYLQQDSKDTQIDSLDEEWAMDLPPFPIDEGLISATVQDANRFFNVNDLVNDAGVAQQAAVLELQRLFVLLEVDDALVHALVDWMDKDDVPYGAFGAEDSMYYAQDYKVKNARLDSWSELKLVLGFDKEILKTLQAVLTVRPAQHNGKTAININTTSVENMMAIFPNMNAIDAETFFESRPYEDTSSINDLYWAEGGNLSRLSVSSDAFMVRTHALFGRANVREEYLLLRTGQVAHMIRRERLGWQF
ncbi:MAG: type II secretion system minor pseudopilin GspK [Mariprofundaceae bacterium]|nr:type II secretion system minor pseudopilin GspK [Mariprofundaceae bacterium]